MKRSFRESKAERGVAMVEFAIALPVLLLLLLAVAELGRLLYHYSNLLQASRDAGRFVAGKAWNRTLGRIELTATLVSQAQNVAVYGVPSSQNGSPVVPELTTDDVSVVEANVDHVMVSISYHFRPVIGNSLPAFFGDPVQLDVPLTASVVMRAL